MIVVFAIGTFTLIFFVIIPAAGIAAVVLIYLVVQAVTRGDNRDENKPK